MAKTAAFGADNVLIAVYASGKEAKAAHNGEKDVLLVTAGKFAELNTDSRFVDSEGEILTVDSLFPALPEKPAKPKKEKGEAVPRVRVALQGPYHVVKDNGARFGVEDERGIVHEALISSATFEEYLSKVPEQIKFTSSRGAEHTEKPEVYARYALRRGWIKLGAAPAADEEQSVPQEEETA